jgi:hypothetical protein
LPTPTPWAQGSTQNVLPRVNPHSILDESNYFPIIANDVVKTYQQRSNKGVPKKQYEPDPKAQTNYTCSVNQLSYIYIYIYIYISIPSNVQNAMEDPKWTRAMNEEMKALQKNNTWEICSLSKGRRQLGVNECL